MKIFRKIRQAYHGLQWQLTGSITLASMLVCLFILIVRLVDTVHTYSTISTSSVVASAVTQLQDNPWFRDVDTKRFTEQPTHEGSDDARPTEMPDTTVRINLNSVFQEMHFDIRFFPPEQTYLYYIDSDFNIYPIMVGWDSKAKDKEGREPGDDLAIREKGIDLAEKTSSNLDAARQMIVTDDNSASMALVPHTDKKNQTNGFYFLYVTDLKVDGMVKSILIFSLKESVAFILFSIFLGLVIGFIFSRRWKKWFDKTTTVLNAWSEGDFSQKIDLKGTPTISEWQDMSGKLNEMADQLSQVVETRQDLAASEERNRIARELHDNIKQQLFSLNMNLGAAQVLYEKKSEQALEKIELASSLSRNTLLELDMLISAMRPVVTTDERFVKDLKKYCDNWTKSSGIALVTDIDEAAKIVDEEISGGIFRICQEALSNIMRHSGADHAELRINVDQIGITLLVKDDGHGFEPAQESNGMGLQSIRERAQKLNGMANIQSRESGTVIRVYVPQKMSV